MVVNAVCCRCGKWFILSEKGVGFARDYCGLCDKCKAEVGDVGQKIEALWRKLEELHNSSQQFHEDLDLAIDQQEYALGNMFGLDGSVVDYLKNYVKIGSFGASTSIKMLAEATNYLLDMYDEGAQGFMENRLEEHYKLAKKGLGLDIDMKDLENLKEVTKNAQKFFDETGDAKEAAKRFLKDAKIGGLVIDAAEFIQNLDEVKEATNVLGDDISTLLLAQKEAKDLAKLLDEIYQNRKNTEKEIECLEEELNNHICIKK